MKKHNRFQIAVVSFFTSLIVFASHTSVASIAYIPSFKDGDTTRPTTLILQGAITPEYVKTIRRLLPVARDDAKASSNGGSTVFPRGIIALELNSPGGDVSSAMLLGALAREEELTAVVRDTSVCASSCVLILAGATYRHASGRVGIHRPYLPNDKAGTPLQQKKQQESIGLSIERFLRSVNVDPDLYKRMARIPPEEVLWLDDTELQRYGLNQDDPYYSDATSTRAAKSMGLNKKDYIRVLSRVKRNCGNDPSPECFSVEYEKALTSK